MTVCRTCYLRSLPHDEMVRIAAEPITMPVHYCPEHQQRAAEIEAVFTKMVREGKVRWLGAASGRFTRFTPFYDSDAALNSWESEGGR